MKISQKIYSLLIFLFIPILYSSNINSAEYPNTSLAVVDINLILNDSKVAIDANKQIEEITDNIQEKLTEDETSLLKEEQKLIEAQGILAPEAFEENRIAFEKNVQNYQMKRQETLQNLDSMIVTVRKKIIDEIKPILEEICEEKGITVVLEKGANLNTGMPIVILNAENMDITKIVLKRLNKILPKIKVEFD